MEIAHFVVSIITLTLVATQLALILTMSRAPGSLPPPDVRKILPSRAPSKPKEKLKPIALDDERAVIIEREERRQRPPVF